MYKISPLNKHFKNSPFVINEETISLGNTDNSSIVFRRHAFTVVRPNLLGLVLNPVDNDTQDDIEKEEAKKGMLSNLVKKVTTTPFKKKIDTDMNCDIEAIPAYVLINPSQWDCLIKTNVDGSKHEVQNAGDTLVSVREFISYVEGKTIKVKFKLKESNVK